MTRESDHHSGMSVDGVIVEDRMNNALRRDEAHAHCFGHRHARPVRALAGRLSDDPGADALRDRGIGFGDARGLRLVSQETAHAFDGEALPPAPNKLLDLPVSHVIAFAPTFSAFSNTICVSPVLLRRVAALDDRAKPIPLGGGEEKGYASSRAEDPHAACLMGIPSRLKVRCDLLARDTVPSARLRSLRGG